VYRDHVVQGLPHGGPAPGGGEAELMLNRTLVPLTHGERVRTLSLLYDAAFEARAMEKHQQCRRGITAPELVRLRQETLRAMEAYADAVESLSWPVPRVVLQEIRLHRSLLGVRPEHRAG
jgi:hypothetical protein